MTKEYIVIEHNSTELTSERSLCPKSITLTSDDIVRMIGILALSLETEQGRFNSPLLNKLIGLIVDDKPLDLRDCKAQIDPEYKARHDE
jgi:hypothetical protein